MQIVTGMHRSGTSLVARLCFEAGADMGDPGVFYPADRWNLDGYYERFDVHSINMPLINGVWGRGAYLFLPSAERILQRSVNKSEQIKKTYNVYQDKLVKETRFCLTLPAWLRNGVIVEKILVCVRDPAQVARSLRRRNHIPMWLGLRLWHEHYSRLLESVGDIPLWFVKYERVIDSNKSLVEIKNALDFLGLKLSDAQVGLLIKKCVKKTSVDYPAIDIKYSKTVQEMLRKLDNKYERQSEQAIECL